MHEINIKIWRNRQDNNWTADINCERHVAVTIEWIQELVHRAILDAEDCLLEEVGFRLQ